MKRTLLVSIALGGLLLAGAGCESTETTPTATTPTDTGTTVTTPVVNDDAAKNNDYQLAATSDNHGQVSLKWTSFGDNQADATQRVLHSAKSNIEFPGRAFWQELPNDRTSYVWEGVPSGVRYFKVCTFYKGKCTAYSNEIELNVK